MKHSKGFTLVELSVAFVIIVLLLAGAMIPLSTQIDLRSVADTQRSMESVREAIIGFAQANGRLPCPANGNVAAGVAGAGTELLAGNSCTATFGVVPWATLGVPETDSWARRFSYAVSPAFADAVALTTWNTRLNAYTTPPPGSLTQAVSSPASPQNQAPICDVAVALTSSSFALCSLGDIAVFTRGDTNTNAQVSGAALPAVIISHGKNGFGAWQVNGTRRNPIPVGNDEAANVNGNTQANPGGYIHWAFYRRSLTPAAAGCVDPIPGATNAAPLARSRDH